MGDYRDESLRGIGLTERQRRILRMLGISKSKEEIATELHLSKAEVEEELKEMRKLFGSVEH